MKACVDRDLLRAEILRQMQDTPVLLSPVSTLRRFVTVKETTCLALDTRHHAIFAMAEPDRFPGASVPIGLSSEVYPSRPSNRSPFEDELVLAVAEAVEQARGPCKLRRSEIHEATAP